MKRAATFLASRSPHPSSPRPSHDTIPTTPFPNRLLDEVMPTLRDTEWRVLCVIVRQTLGYFDASTGRRKQSDWLTQSQLIQRTGRYSAALARAIETLVQRDLIEVHTVNGESLETRARRRRMRGRCFYALHSSLRRRVKTSVLPLKAEKRQDGHISHEQWEEREAWMQLSQSESGAASKANRTKETLTKRGMISKDEEDAVLASSEYSEALGKWLLLFQSMAGSEAPLRISISQKERLETLLERHSHTDWPRVLRDYFQSDSPYLLRHQHSLEAFLHSCHLFLLRRT